MHTICTHLRTCSRIPCRTCISYGRTLWLFPPRKCKKDITCIIDLSQIARKLLPICQGRGNFYNPHRTSSCEPPIGNLDNILSYILRTWILYLCFFRTRKHNCNQRWDTKIYHPALKQLKGKNSWCNYPCPFLSSTFSSLFHLVLFCTKDRNKEEGI